MTTRRLHPLYFDTSGITLEMLTEYATGLCEQQRDVNWHLGDAVRRAKHMLGEENWSQAFPEWYSVDHLARCEAVAKAYPKREDRNPEATWSVHRNEANHPQRIQRVQAHVEEGRTSDEARKATQEEREEEREQDRSSESKTRWLLAIDVNYHLTRTWASGAGTEAAMQVSQWIVRTVERLREKGLSDVLCCFDSPSSFRKDLTAKWEDGYKPRATKDQEHSQQIVLVEELLREKGFCCAKQEGFEADDLMASAARQFDGKVTLLTQDKDMRQLLGTNVNMLTDIEWVENETSGEAKPQYNWLTAKDHVEGCTYNSSRVEGIKPEQWVDFQTLAGDGTDGVSGAQGIGAKTAADLIRHFGTAEAAIAAAKEHDERIKPAKRQALIEFEQKLEVTRQLVRLRCDLPLPTSTRI